MEQLTPTPPVSTQAFPPPPRDRGIPDGPITWSDDPDSPYYLEEAARPYWQDPTIADRIAAASGRTLVFPPKKHQPEEQYSLRGLPMGTDYTDQAVDRLQTYQSPEWLTFSLAADRAREAATRAARDAEDRAAWTASHRCAVCGIVAGDVGTRVVLDVPAGRADGTVALELRAQACPPCSSTLALVALEAHAADRVDGRRTRRDLARDYLARQ